MDSTKKVCRKLQGSGAGTAAWATSVGNERGEIVQCVLTASEAGIALQPMANGLMDRFDKANHPAPSVIYTDRDCCSGSGRSHYAELFSRWPDLQVRLDIWHYMRRLAQGCSTESHPLYGTFMSRLSGCIFEWDPHDYQQLQQAKREEFEAAGARPDEKTVRKAVTADELARHCRSVCN